MKLKHALVCLLFLLPFISHASPQEDWIEKLRQCESQGHDEITILDSNSKYSYGGLQFQLGTFLGFGKIYGILPEVMRGWEAKLLIHNIHIQRAIARRMLDDGLSYHWKNCVRKISEYPISGVDS